MREQGPPCHVLQVAELALEPLGLVPEVSLLPSGSYCSCPEEQSLALGIPDLL